MAGAAALSPASAAGTVVAHLRTLRSPDNVAGMARYGIRTDAALGISNSDLRRIARLIGRDHGRAHELWATGIREARRWADDFASWEIVDAAADLFVEARLETALVPRFARDEREFVRRAAFAMVAGAAVHLKREPDATLLDWLPLIERHAGDDRNFVRKAVNWALRNIGKHSMACHAAAMKLAEKLATSGDRTARWIGKDAMRELSGEKTLARLRNKEG